MNIIKKIWRKLFPKWKVIKTLELELTLNNKRYNYETKENVILVWKTRKNESKISWQNAIDEQEIPLEYGKLLFEKHKSIVKEIKYAAE